MASTSNALNHDMTWSARVNKHFSFKGSVTDALLSSYNDEEYDSGDPCKQKGALGGVAMNIEKLFTVLKAVQKYGDLYIDGAINKVADLQSKISSITSAIAGILKTLVQRLRNWTLNYLKALISAALDYIATNFVKTIKNIAQKKKTLGEPDTTAEKHRDEPQPQYEEEESKDADEASVAGGVAGFTAPLGHGNGPGDKPYKKNKK